MKQEDVLIEIEQEKLHRLISKQIGLSYDELMMTKFDPELNEFSLETKVIFDTNETPKDLMDEIVGLEDGSCIGIGVISLI
jgi:hypothetical protein